MAQEKFKGFGRPPKITGGKAMEASNTSSEEVTQAEATAVGAAGARRINPETQTAEQAKVVAREDMQAEAKRLDLQMSPESIDQIADRFIDKLSEMGAFRKQSEETEETQQEEVTAESSAGENNPPPVEKSKLANWLGL